MLAKVKAVAVKVGALVAKLVNFAEHVEPARAYGAYAAVVAVVAGWRSGHLTIGLVGAAIAAVQAALTRRKVTPFVKMGG